MTDSIESQLTAVRKDVAYMGKQLDKIEELLENEYVTQDQHSLVVQRVDVLQKIVWGFVGLVLIAFVGGLINFVFNGKL